jgi:hypothetical protein
MHDRIGGGADVDRLPLLAGQAACSARSGLLEVDLVAERFELASESASAMFG